MDVDVQNKPHKRICGWACANTWFCPLSLDSIIPHQDALMCSWDIRLLIIKSLERDGDNRQIMQVNKGVIVSG